MEENQSGRKSYSLQRLAEVADGLEDVRDLLAESDLCIYATGSYGRLEAWEASDIDLFFLYEDVAAYRYLAFIRVAARLIETTEAMRFPPFSGDGRYLESLDVATMERILGSRGDDHTNTFTARMLLLLESQPVTDEERYQELLARIVSFYYRDLSGHEDDFVPTFLVNDILRFWRTLTLNYEHDRYQVGVETDPVRQKRESSKSSLKNYKLKHSRLATCFSMVAHLASERAPVRAERVVELCRITPQERFAQLRGRTSAADDLIAELHERYEAFLRCVQRSEEELLPEFSDPASRRARLGEAAGYGDAIYQLLTCVVPGERMRQLVI
jgi:predicted nucleotidyltransferase